MFQLHPTLEKDSLPIFETDALLIRLINDARFPWGLIVPRVAAMTELHDLPDEAYANAMRASVKLGRVMKAAMVRLAGRTVDGKRVNAIAQEKLRAASR